MVCSDDESGEDEDEADKDVAASPAAGGGVDAGLSGAAVAAAGPKVNWLPPFLVVAKRIERRANLLLIRLNARPPRKLSSSRYCPFSVLGQASTHLAHCVAAQPPRQQE